MPFRMVTDLAPQGGQPQAIAALVRGLHDGVKHQVLLGVTGSGKTYTMARVIEAVDRPTLVLAPNKTLEAQRYSEFRGYFPDNAVEYFVSYYDYYQPEAYVPSSDTYLEKAAVVRGSGSAFGAGSPTCGPRRRAVMPLQRDLTRHRSRPA